jgi:hypothetical protein
LQELEEREKLEERETNIHSKGSGTLYPSFNLFHQMLVWNPSLDVYKFLFSVLVA